MKRNIICYAIPLCVLFLLGAPGRALALQDFLRFQSTSVGGGTVVTLGPDRKLYFMEQDGDIFRHQIDQARGLPTGVARLKR